MDYKTLILSSSLLIIFLFGCNCKDIIVKTTTTTTNGNDSSSAAILVPILDSIKSINHDHIKFNPKEKAIVLHEIHHPNNAKHYHHLLPHKIIIEEEEEIDDDDQQDDLSHQHHHHSQLPITTIIKEKESFVHKETPERMNFPITSTPLHDHHHLHPLSPPPPLPAPMAPGPGSPILVHMVSPSIRRKHDNSIPDLLAVLAPLAAIPLIGSLAVSSFTTMLTLTGLGRRRRRKRDLAIHDKVLNFLNSNADLNQSLPTYSTSQQQSQQMNFNNPDHHNHNFNHNEDNPDSSYHQNNQTMVPISELFQLDIVQQYLRQSGRPDHNDEIIASYLSCRGMFQPDNNCLERLACHYADMQQGRLRPLERDVAALIIYSLLRNSHIDQTFKRRLQRAALFGYDHATDSSESSSSSKLNSEPSFVAVCDREYPCPRSVVP